MIWIFGDSYLTLVTQMFTTFGTKNLNDETTNFGKAGTGPIYTMSKVYSCITNDKIQHGDKMVVMLSDPRREEHYDGMHSRMCLVNYIYFLKVYSKNFNVRTICFTCFNKDLDAKMVKRVDSSWFRRYEHSLSSVSVGETGEKIPERDSRSNHLGEKNHIVLEASFATIFMVRQTWKTGNDLNKNRSLFTMLNFVS